jgi:hypothetical protein
MPCSVVPTRLWSPAVLPRPAIHSLATGWRPSGIPATPAANMTEYPRHRSENARLHPAGVSKPNRSSTLQSPNSRSCRALHPPAACSIRCRTRERLQLPKASRIESLTFYASEPVILLLESSLMTDLSLQSTSSYRLRKNSLSCPFTQTHQRIGRGRHEGNTQIQHPTGKVYYDEIAVPYAMIGYVLLTIKEPEKPMAGFCK